MRALLLAAVIAAPLNAQTLDPRYTATGSFSGSLDGAPLALTSVSDKSGGRHMITVQEIAGMNVTFVNAMSISAAGGPTPPALSITIWPGAAGVMADVALNMGDVSYQSDADIGGRVPLSDYVQDGTTVSFGINATLPAIRLDGSEYVMDPAGGDVALTGTFSGKLPVE